MDVYADIKHLYSNDSVKFCDKLGSTSSPALHYTNLTLERACNQTMV